MPPEKHALLSASSAARWLNCTAAPRFEEGLPESTSEYAEEGRLAHAIAELKTLKKFTVMTSRTYTTRLNKLKKDPLYSEEMDKTSDLYIEHLIEQAMLYDSTPTVVAEVQVDFGEYVPEGFGTCDNVMIGGDTLSITDYKHGKGVPVSAVGNPQMRLYALGALKRYAPVFGDAIKKVRMSIDQPRLDSYTTDIITVEELKALYQKMLYNTNLQNAIMDDLLANSTFKELPKEVTDYQVNQCLNYYYTMANYYGYDLDSFVQTAAGYENADALLEGMSDSITTYSKEALLYQAVAETLDIVPTQEQIDTYSSYTGTYGENYCTMVALMDAVTDALTESAVVS